MDEIFSEPTMNVAMLLSCSSFEAFFGRVLGRNRHSYLENYRNDWSWYYAKGLMGNQIRPTIYIPSLYECGKYPTDAGIDVRFLPLSPWYKPFDRLFLKRLSRRTRWSLYIDERINTMAFMAALREALQADEIHLLYIQEYWSGRFDHIVQRIDLPVTGADHGGRANGVVKWFKRTAMKKAVLCYGQTEAECRLIEKYSGLSKIQPNGCDTGLFFPNPTVSRDKTVLIVARLTDKQKRISDLIRAMAQLPQDWSLDILGTGPDKTMLERLAMELGIAARVRFHGFVDRVAVRDFLWRCGVYAMPSANEAVAIAALEAMGCGAAVVLSRIGTFEQLIQDGITGRLVAVGDVKGLAVGIMDAWDNRLAWGQGAYTTVQKRYDSRMLYRELAQSFRSVATRK